MRTTTASSLKASWARLAGIEDAVNVSAEDASYTDPTRWRSSSTRTGVDSLAIAIGTSHGAYKFKPGTEAASSRFDILEEVSQAPARLPDRAARRFLRVRRSTSRSSTRTAARCPTPSASPRNMLRKAASMAVCKINIDSDLRLAMTGHHPPVLQRASRPLRPAPVPQARPRQHQEAGPAQDRRRARLQRQSVSFGPHKVFSRKYVYANRPALWVRRAVFVLFPL